MSTPPYSPVDSQPDDIVLTRSRALSRPQKPVDIKIPDSTDEPIDRQGLASTPLLPPLVDDRRTHSCEAFSPLQSPSVAGPSATTSIVGTPTLGPFNTGMPTPPLSSQPSYASFKPAHTHLYPTSEIPAMSISHAHDPWATKLGHANFHIEPEPYFPETSTLQASERLLDDWANARAQYSRQAHRISENYGPTSQIYKDTEAKWAEIDAQWRAYHDRVKAEAEANGEVEEIQRTLARDTRSTSRLPLPTLSDPDQPSKFPKIDDSDIVGPMVQYEVQRKGTASSAKIRPTLLKLFTDPASLLGIMRK
ncbi:Only proline and serine are matching in the corresponding protein [Teratosphaeria destructans]|uniref:Only proline and serine are matching in the corresponding protein n=1 Tax=Teratosphaeria destructans TaxID=418781 RepID=A0A9W7VYX3_9PEZI|nr:Only proline and serine are matching in the corresponding protein [Teratosphaeria destructans]